MAYLAFTDGFQLGTHTHTEFVRVHVSHYGLLTLLMVKEVARPWPCMQD